MWCEQRGASRAHYSHRYDPHSLPRRRRCLGRAGPRWASAESRAAADEAPARSAARPGSGQSRRHRSAQSDGNQHSGTPLHSINSSARASSAAGTVSPSALAVRRLQSGPPRCPPAATASRPRNAPPPLRARAAQAAAIAADHSTTSSARSTIDHLAMRSQSASDSTTGAWSLGRSLRRGALSMMQASTLSRSAALTRMWSMRSPWFLRKARLR